MNPGRLAAALGLAVACGGQGEAPAELRPWAEGCSGLAGEHLDWCLFGNLQEDESLASERWFAACGGFRTPEVRDQCYETLIRRDPSFGRNERVCKSITEPRFRDSCYLEWLRGVTVPSATSLDEAVKLCAKAGALKEHCAVHVLQQWSATWAQRGGEPVMRQDVTTMLQLDPELAHSKSFGNSAGLFPGRAGYTKPCGLFPPGEARASCEDVVIDGVPPPGM